jgi:hypothetical protein
METKQKEALEKIKGLVETQVVRSEGEDNTPPSFLEIYNLACDGLNASSHSSNAVTINCSVTKSDMTERNSQSKQPLSPTR